MKTRIQSTRRNRTHWTRVAWVLAPLAVLALNGCTSMSGLSGTSNYACKAPDGVTCESVTGTYTNALQNNLPTQRRPIGASEGMALRAAPTIASTASAGTFGGAASRTRAPPSAAAATSTTALRSTARILRLWFKPWEDADRDLHDQGYVYVRVDDGQWLVEHVQRHIREAYAPLRPPARPSGGAIESRDAPSATPPTRPSGPLLLPGLTPPVGRPQLPTEPASHD